MKKVGIIIFVIVFLLLICLIPIKTVQKDGGTVVYSAVLYKVIIWHRGYITEQNEPDFITGTDFYFFPFNFGEKQPK